MSKHVVLLGDSIFDNAAYVPGEPCVTEQLQALRGTDDTITMLAVDGHRVYNVLEQLQHLPSDATHLIVSAGGNDALMHIDKLEKDYDSAAEMFIDWTLAQDAFRGSYRRVLATLKETRLAVGVCTVYDAVPDIDRSAITALSLFNDVIVAEAVAARVPIVALRHVCSDESDYSHISPIEPSAQGGEKIAAALHRVVDQHDFEAGLSVVYV